jgi:hypothetical protein
MFRKSHIPVSWLCWSSRPAISLCLLYDFKKTTSIPRHVSKTDDGWYMGVRWLSLSYPYMQNGHTFQECVVRSLSRLDTENKFEDNDWHNLCAGSGAFWNLQNGHLGMSWFSCAFSRAYKTHLSRHLQHFCLLRCMLRAYTHDLLS